MQYMVNNAAPMFVINSSARESVAPQRSRMGRAASLFARAMLNALALVTAATFIVTAHAGEGEPRQTSLLAKADGPSQPSEPQARQTPDEMAEAENDFVGGQARPFTGMLDDDSPEALLVGPDSDDTLPLERLEPMLDAERAIEEELEMGPRPSFPLNVRARLAENGAALPHGLVWRVFRAEQRSSGAFELVEESRDAMPSFLLPADDYIVHVAYGLANAATMISLRTGPVEEEVTLEAGGLRVTSVDSSDQAIPERMVSLSMYAPEEDDYGQRRELIEHAAPGTIIRLNPGTYHVVSQFGDANAVVRADVQVKPGELTDARIQHRAAAITFKLVHEPGGEALADTAWTILTPGGETVKESFGAFPTHVLVEGNYSLIARHGGRTFNREFDVVPGRDREIELVAR